MNEQDYFDYFLEVGAMKPEDEKLKRKQAMVDYLRQSAMNTPEGQMVGRTYVAPSFAQYAAQLGNAFMARKGQQAADQDFANLTDTRRARLEALRMKRGANASAMDIDEELRKRNAAALAGMSMPQYDFG